MRRLLVLALPALLLAGCASTQRNEALTNTLNAYAGAVRCCQPFAVISR